MKSVKRLITLALSLALVLSCTSCDTVKKIAGDAGEFAGDIAGDLNIELPWDQKQPEEVIDDSLNGYLIIRGDDAGNKALEVSAAIRQAMNELGYADAAVKTDYAGKDNPPKKEILIGTTNRPENIDISALSDNDYIIKGVDKKILITAKSDEALVKASEYFVSEILPDLHEGKILCADVDYTYTHQYDVKRIFVGDAPVNECAIIVGADVTGVERQALDALLQSIYNVSGLSFLEVRNEADAQTEENTTPSAYIYFGGMSDEVKKLKTSLEADQYGFVTASDGKSIVCASNARYGLTGVVEKLSHEFFGDFAPGFKSSAVNIITSDAGVLGRMSHEKVLSQNLMALEATLADTDKTVVTGLATDGLVNPIGMDNTTPRLSWYMKSPEYGEGQLSYRVGVATSMEALLAGDYNVWDSDVVETSDNFVVIPPYESEDDDSRDSADKNDKDTPDEDAQNAEQTEESDVPSRFEKSSRYFWHVTLETKKSGKVTSPAAFFETGLLDDGFEDASWICSDDYYCTATAGAVEAKFTLGKNAAGVSFGISENEDFYYMWQFNTSNHGYAVLRPHVYKDGAWAYLPEVSLKNMFPDAASASEKPVVMKIDINNGIITTRINGNVVSTNTVEAFPIGGAKKRLSGGESAEYEYVRILDESGAILSDGEKTGKIPMYRHDFEVPEYQSVIGARLYASALGAYEVYLNGQKLGSSMLNPGRTAYNNKIYYQTYDVTPLVSQKNAIAAVVGDGWYNSGIVGGSYGERNAFIAKLVLVMEDGSEKTVTTGEGWEFTLDGPVLSADFYEGENYDARREMPGFAVYSGVNDWQEANVCTEESVSMLMSGIYTPGELVAEAMEPVRVVSEFTPVAVTNPAPGVYVYDFGQNMAGTVSLTAEEGSGKEIILNYGEVLRAEDGMVDIAYMLGHNGVDKYIFAGKPGGETFMPSLVYHGFRYLQIEGLDHALDKGKVKAYAMSTDMERTGTFESGNFLLNRYYENTLRSQQSNFVSNLTDCPTREKNGWTGDAQIFAKTGAYNMNVVNVYENFMEMLRMSMSPAGAVPEILPARGTSNNTKTPAGWSDAVITIPYELYKHYGDIAFLEDNYDAMKEWIAYLLRFKFVPDKDDYVRDDGNYGDHLAYYNNKSGVGYTEKEYNGSNTPVQRETSYSEIGTAYAAYSTILLSEVSDILGYDEDSAYYRDLHDKFATAWRQSFLEDDGFTPKSRSQTSYVMGLHFGLYESEKSDDAFKALCADIEQKGYQTVGFIGMSYLYDVLSEGTVNVRGRTDLVYKLLLNTTSPSLLYPVTQDATTTWESYNGGSRNHYVQGAPVRWLYTDILGIRLSADKAVDMQNVDVNTENEGNTAVGFESILLEPRVNPDIGYAKGAYVSANGVIKSAWTAEPDGAYTYTCTIPANTSALIQLPVDNTRKYNCVVSGKDGKKVPDNCLIYVKYPEEQPYIGIKALSGEYTFKITYTN